MQIPKYELIAETLSREIRDGVHAEGTLLPTEAQLSERFDVSRHTIRHGLRALRERGLVKSRQGRGTEVVRRQERLADSSRHVLDGFAAAPFDWPFRLGCVATVTPADRADVESPTAPLLRPMLSLSGVFRDDSSGEEAEARIFLDEECGDVVPRLGGDRLPDLLAGMHGLRPAEIVQDLRCEIAGDEACGLGKLVLTRRYVDGEGGIYMVLRAVCPPAAFCLHSTMSGVD